MPLYEGFTMPPSTLDSETAAMFKSLHLRALSVQVGDDPVDVRFANAFAPLCDVPGRHPDPNQAFTSAWLAHVQEQSPLAVEAAPRFLERYEYKSLWNTQEIHDRLETMWPEAQLDRDEYDDQGEKAMTRRAQKH